MSIAGQHFPHSFGGRRAPSRRRLPNKLDRKTVRQIAIVFVAAIAVLLVAKTLATLLSRPSSEPAPQTQTVGYAPAAAAAAPPVHEVDVSWSKLEPTSRSFKVTVEEDSGLKLNGRAARLYGFQVIPRSKICTYATGERWACGQRARVAMLNSMGATTVECRERNTGVPLSIDTPRSYVCQLPATDIAELLLRNGWGTVEDGNSEPRYVAAAAAARSLQAGMWRQAPANP